MKGFILLCMFMSMSLLYMEIGNTIFFLQNGYIDKEIKMGCVDYPDSIKCPSHDWIIIPITMAILGIMLFFMYVFVTDILLTRRQRIEN